MTHWKIARRLMLALTLAAMAAMPAAQAAEKSRMCSQDPVATPLSKGKAQALMDWLKDPGTSTKPSVQSFKVPGLGSTKVLCKLGPDGLRCFEVLVTLRCPTAVDVDTAGGSTTVPVNCTGPDADGTCDCDFAEG